MPHSTTITPADHRSTNMHQSNPMTPTASTKPSSTISSNDSQHAGQTPLKPQNRKSLPDSGIYAELIGNTNIDEFLHKHLGSRESVMATYNGCSKPRTQFHEDQLQYKENQHGPVREKIQRDSPVIAELRTNVIIKDEYTLVTELSHHLAARYTRPDSAVMVKVDHSACIAMGGTFEPCYILSITAVPSQMGPTMNKRNAALVQSFLAESLGVPAERGVIKFLPIPEENFGTNGTTIFGEMERQEKNQVCGDGVDGVGRAANSMGKKSFSNFKKSPAKESTLGLGSYESRPNTNRTDSVATVRISEERQGTLQPQSATITNVGEIFELPTTEMERNRPIPTQPKGQAVGSNGLALNGISSGATPYKTPKREKIRPRTISTESPYAQNQIKSPATATANAIPLGSSGSPTRQTRPPSFLKIDPTQTQISSARHKFHHRSNRQSTTATTATTPERVKSRNSHLGNVKGTMKHAKGEWTIIDNTNNPGPPNGKLEAKKDEGKKEDTEANTAKRRSTITATPKMPEGMATTAVVPVDGTDAKSTKSMKVGKRKSFLAAFRRNGNSNVQQVAAG